MPDKPILAFDCTTPIASLALQTGGLVHVRQLEINRHAAELVSAVDALMREHGCDYSQLGCIVTTIGPGSFTGVRIGLAALHGFALAASIPVKILTSLEAVAWAVAENDAASDAFFTGMRAGKGEAYMQGFVMEQQKPRVRGEIFLCPEADATTHAPYFGNVQPREHTHYLDAPDASVLCRIANHLPECALHDALPLYVRPPDAAIAAPLPWLA